MPRALQRRGARPGRSWAAAVAVAAALLAAAAPAVVAHAPKPDPSPRPCTPRHKAAPGQCAGLAEILVRARSGVEVPLGAVVPPALTQGQPAQVLVRLGPDPLGIAATLEVDPEVFWGAARASVTATGPGFTARGGIQADGSALVSFTPPEPGPVRMHMYVPGRSLLKVIGHAPARGWSVFSWVVYAGQAPGSPVLAVEGLPKPPPNPGPEPMPEPAPIPGPEPAP